MTFLRYGSTVSRPEEMEPGATLFAVNKSDAATDPGAGWIVAPG